MRNSTNLLSEWDFYRATTLREQARNKFEQAGFLTPVYQGFSRFYSEHDVLVVRTMLQSLDGKIDLRHAYEQAISSLHRKAA